MRDNLPEPTSPTRLPSLYFEYGADQILCQKGVEISERGMCFYSRWRFAPATQLGLALSFRARDGSLQQLRTEGIVVGCEPVEKSCYKVTLLFLDLSEGLKPAIRDLAYLLHPIAPEADATRPEVSSVPQYEFGGPEDESSSNWAGSL